MVLIGATLAAVFALGALLVVLGLRGVDQDLQHRPAVRSAINGRTLLRAVAATGAALLVLALTGWPVAAGVAAVATIVGPSAVRRSRDHAAAIERTEAVAAWTEMLRDTLAAAAGLEEAILVSARNAPDAIAGPVQRLAARLERGQLTQALATFAHEVDDPIADLVVAGLSIAARREARDLVGMLGALATSARSEAEMRRRVHASRARIRTTVRVVLTTLAGFAVLLLLFNRDYLSAYDSATGQVVLAVVAAIFAGGGWLLHRMARIETPERFFAPPTSGGRG